MPKPDPAEFLAVVKGPLQCGSASQIADAVHARWDPKDLCALLGDPSSEVRGVAALTLGLVGDRRVIGCLSRALHDKDRQVHDLAEDAMWSIWFRGGAAEACPAFRKGVAAMSGEHHARAIAHLTEAITADPAFSEAYNQRGIAYYLLGDYEASLADCLATVEHMPAHFGAHAGIGHCHAQAERLGDALAAYEKALAINPRMPGIDQTADRLRARMHRKLNESGVYSLSLGGD